MIPGGKRRKRDNKEDLTFVVETEKGRMPGQKEQGLLGESREDGGG